MVRTITILHTPGCPNAALARHRVERALARLRGPVPEIVVEEIANPDEAAERRFHGSPSLLFDGVDVFPTPASPAAFACRVYRTENGIEGAPSIEQIAAALASS
jgi:hypothetical protein